MITTTGDTKQNIVKLTVKALHHEHHFYILEQPPYHFSPQQIRSWTKISASNESFWSVLNYQNPYLVTPLQPPLSL